MGYPDRMLGAGEKVVEHLHPHWITLVPAVFWFLLICAAGGLGIGYAPGGSPWHLIVVLIVVVAGLILLGWLAVAPWLAWRTTHYVFTDRRVLIRSGVLRRTGRDISLQRISDVGFSQSLWDRIVRAGTLTIESASEHGQQVLRNIPRSEQQQQQLNHLIEQDAARRARDAAGGGYGPGDGGDERPGPAGPSGSAGQTRRLPAPGDPDA